MKTNFPAKTLQWLLFSKNDFLCPLSRVYVSHLEYETDVASVSLLLWNVKFQEKPHFCQIILKNFKNKKTIFSARWTNDFELSKNPVFDDAIQESNKGWPFHKFHEKRHNSD